MIFYFFTSVFSVYWPIKQRQQMLSVSPSGRLSDAADHITRVSYWFARFKQRIAKKIAAAAFHCTETTWWLGEKAGSWPNEWPSTQLWPPALENNVKHWMTRRAVRCRCVEPRASWRYTERLWPDETWRALNLLFFVFFLDIWVSGHENGPYHPLWVRVFIVTADSSRRERFMVIMKEKIEHELRVAVVHPCVSVCPWCLMSRSQKSQEEEREEGRESTLKNEQRKLISVSRSWNQQYKPVISFMDVSSNGLKSMSISGGWFMVSPLSLCGGLSVFFFLFFLNSKIAKRPWSVLRLFPRCSYGGGAKGPSTPETPWRYRMVIHRSVRSAFEESEVRSHDWSLHLTYTNKLSNHVNCSNPIFAQSHPVFFHVRSTWVGFLLKYGFAFFR